MEHNEFKKIEQEAKRIGLRAHEKEETKQHLVAFMRLHPVRNTAVARLVGVRSGSFINHFAHSMPIVLILAVLFGGVAFGAEGSLPGDALYSIKVGVNEKIVEALSFSTEKKADWEADLASRRLDEAEKLASKGELSSEKKESIAARFESHIENVGAKLDALEKKDDFRASAAVSSKLESELSSHEKFLKTFSEEFALPVVLSVPDAAGEDAEVTEEKEQKQDPFLEKLKMQKEFIADRRASAEEKMAQGAMPDVRTAAEGSRKAALQVIEEIKKFLAARDLGAEALARVTSQIQDAEKLITAGDTKMEAGAYGDAFAIFQKAQRVAQESKFFMDGEKSVLPVLPSKRDEGRDDEGITNFEECIAAGYSVMESIPRQCRTSEGEIFVEGEKDGASAPPRPTLVPPSKWIEPIGPKTDVLASLKREAKSAECADISNRLFVIDEKLVFWDRRGECPDNRYSYELRDLSTDAMVCNVRDTFGGPLGECSSPELQSLLNVMSANLGRTDLGLGSTHKIQAVSF